MYSEETLTRILSDLSAGSLSLKRALHKLKHLPYETIRFARLDHHRHLRTRLPEVVYAPGKTFSQLQKIIRAFKRGRHTILVTRLTEALFLKLKKTFPFLSYSVEGKIAYYKPKGESHGRRSAYTIAVLTAGTSDIPVAEEAAVTLEVMQRKVVRLYDCGVAGLHRLIDVIPQLQKVDCIICVAGMEGALASVVAGLVDRPVIAVPTSVGYGASFSGIAPLLTMLNSCAPGVVVVNIDNGFGAACFALMLFR